MFPLGIGLLDLFRGLPFIFSVSPGVSQVFMGFIFWLGHILISFDPSPFFAAVASNLAIVVRTPYDHVSIARFAYEFFYIGPVPTPVFSSVYWRVRVFAAYFAFLDLLCRVMCVIYGVILPCTIIATPPCTIPALYFSEDVVTIL